jgi:hypothetical protein
MWVRLLPPFGNGKTWQEFDLPPEAGVQDLVQVILKNNPYLQIYLRPTLEETFHQFIFLRDDYVLEASDRIGPEDRIVMVMPLTGG